MHSGANVLILDEPTNHLDLESREALEAALQAFPGSLLLISHDRALLDAVGSRTVAVEEQTLHSYVGGWPEYLRVREERAEAEKTAKRAKPAPPPKPKPAGAVEEPAAPRGRAGEGDRGRRGGAARRSRQELADPGAWNDPRTRRQVDQAPHRGQARARSALRGVGVMPI